MGKIDKTKRNSNQFVNKNKVKFNKINNKESVKHLNKSLNVGVEKRTLRLGVKQLKKSDENKTKLPINNDFFVTSINKNNKSSSSSRNENTIMSNDKKMDVDNKVVKIKKPFDKKRWRLQKYSKKYKLDQWEEKRKKTVLREYYREIKDEDKQFNVEKIYQEEEERDDKSNNVNEEVDGGRTNEENENDNNVNVDIRTGQMSNREEQINSNTTKRKAFKKAHMEYERIKAEKNRKRDELNRKKTERDEALKVYKEKKVKKFKALSRKTRKGQPIMKDRMEMLLEQIQNNLDKD